MQSIAESLNDAESESESQRAKATSTLSGTNALTVSPQPALDEYTAALPSMGDAQVTCPTVALVGPYGDIQNRAVRSPHSSLLVLVNNDIGII